MTKTKCLNCRLEYPPNKLLSRGQWTGWCQSCRDIMVAKQDADARYNDHQALDESDDAIEPDIGTLWERARD